MLSSIQKMVKLFSGAFEETTLLEGTSDIVVVRWDSGEFKATPFLACFGHQAATADSDQVRVAVNGREIKDVHFTLDRYGYIHPMRPSQETIENLALAPGQNLITFSLTPSVSITT